MRNLIETCKATVLLCTILFFAYSCSKDNDAVPEDQELTQAELKTILETDDVSASVDTILADIYANDGATGKGSNECYAAEYTETGFTVDFNNCVLNGTDNANGSLAVTYAAEGENATFSATYVDFYVGNIKLNGTRTYSIDGNETQGTYSFSVTSEMTATMEDGSVISQNGTKTFGLTFGETLESSTFSIAGNWTLYINGNTYSVAVTDTLTGNLSCGYMTSGSMDINKNGLEVTVDFGDGDCDEMASVIYPNGATQDLSMKD